jgi:uncharacterized metal-binding protein YceD (DUF177 family)
VSKKNKEYVVPFTGLKLGKHNFEFVLLDEFFEGFEYSIVEGGKVHVDFELEKKETMMIGTFELQGEVKSACDRCNDPCEVHVDGSFRVYYKFDNEPSDDETLIIVYPDEVEIYIAEQLLEFVTVSLPARVLHEDEEDCNEEMIDLLDDYVINPDDSEEEEESEIDDENDEITDPRWDALRGLKNNKD